MEREATQHTDNNRLDLVRKLATKSQIDGSPDFSSGLFLDFIRGVHSRLKGMLAPGHSMRGPELAWPLACDFLWLEAYVREDRTYTPDDEDEET